jgi:hypothetical protein
MVIVDGKSRGVDPGRIALATGPHRVRIERGGFEPLERDVDIAPASAATTPFVLEPTPETRADYVSKASSRRTYGWIAVAAGGAVALGGLGYFVINQSSKNDAQAKHDQLELEFETMTGACDLPSGVSAEACNSARQSALNDLNAAKNRSTIALVTAGVGAAIAGVGAYLLLSGDDPHRYDRRPSGETSRFHLVPSATLAPSGGWAGVTGSF